MAMHSAEIASSTVAGSAFWINCQTGRRLMYDLPRSPLSACSIQRAYWTGQRLIEPHVGADRRHHLRRRVRTRQQQGRVTRHQMQQQEDGKRCQNQDGHRLHQPPDDEDPHAVTPPIGLALKPSSQVPRDEITPNVRSSEPFTAVLSARRSSAG